MKVKEWKLFTLGTVALATLLVSACNGKAGDTSPTPSPSAMPESATTHALYELGQSKEKAGSLPEAETAYWQAIETSTETPEYWMAWTRVALSVLGLQGAYEKLEGMLKAHPETAWGHTMMASLVLRNGYPKVAFAEADEAIKLNPKIAEAWQIKGASAVELQNYSEAVEAFQQALILTPKDPRILIGLGEALFLTGKPKEALPYLQEAVQIAPEQGATHLQIGVLLLSLANSPDELADARRSLEQALERENTLVLDGRFNTLLALGQCSLKQEQGTEAKAFLERAATLKPNDATVYFELMKVYRRLKDTKQFNRARQEHTRINAYLNEARKLTTRIGTSPADPEARLALARLHAKNGAYRDAIQVYRYLLLKFPDKNKIQKEYDIIVDKYSRNKPNQ